MDRPQHASPEWADRRRQMVDKHLRNRGLRDARVLKAMATIPRERFVTSDNLELACADRALPIECGQTISQPYIVAYMTEHLLVTPTSRVLEIGTGSGYQTAVLAALAARVYTIERVAELAQLAKERLADLGVTNVDYECGDGTLGRPRFAPYDRVIVTAAAADIPQPLIDQLASDGVLVAPVGRGRTQTIVRLTRRGDHTERTPMLPCRFVRLVGEQGWRPA